MTRSGALNLRSGERYRNSRAAMARAASAVHITRPHNSDPSPRNCISRIHPAAGAFAAGVGTATLAWW